jgi:hypothetical protein
MRDGHCLRDGLIAGATSSRTDLRHKNNRRAAWRSVISSWKRRAFRMTKRGYIYINNRLEGFAPETIAAILERLAAEDRKYVLIL